MLSVYDDVSFIYTLCRQPTCIALRHHNAILIMDPIVCRFIFISTISRFYFMAFFFFATCLIPILGKPWRLALCSRNRAGLNTRKEEQRRRALISAYNPERFLVSHSQTGKYAEWEKKDAAKGLATITEMENGRCTIPPSILLSPPVWL